MRIYWGGSAYRDLTVPHVISLLSFAHRCLQEDVPLSYEPKWGDALITRSRNRSATKFLLESDCDVWLSVDADIEFRAAAALQLCQQALEYDVVGGLYMTRSSRHGIPTSYLQEGVRYRFWTDPTPQPIRYLATGFMAVRREVFETLATGLELEHADESDMRQYPFFETQRGESDGKPIRLSEDWAFCERARQVGFGIWLNPAIRLKHYGMSGFVLEDLITVFPETQEVVITRTPEGLQIEHGVAEAVA